MIGTKLAASVVMVIGIDVRSRCPHSSVRMVDPLNNPQHRFVGEDRLLSRAIKRKSHTFSAVSYDLQ